MKKNWYIVVSLIIIFMFVAGIPLGQTAKKPYELIQWSKEPRLQGGALKTLKQF